MSQSEKFDLEPWTGDERVILRQLTSPARVQDFLDEIPYSTSDDYRSPRQVIRDRQAHCFDGALLAAAALCCLNHPPLIMELKAERDDDHLLAIYWIDGACGAIGKSNFAGLRFREPVHRTVRELAMTYFNDYYNVEGEKTLRAYSVVLNLDRLPLQTPWRTDPAAMDEIARRLDRVRHYPLISQFMAGRLEKTDARTYQAGLLGSDARGLYQPE